VREPARSCLTIAVLLLAACAPLRSGTEPPALRYASRTPAAPAALTMRLETLARGFEGRVGIAVHDVQAGWTAESLGLSLLPQQSVSKLWVAVAVLDMVDRGLLSLDEPVTVTAADLSVFNQPIREKLVGGGYATTLGDLLVMQIALSDNAANDILVRRIGGPDAVQRTIAAKRLGAIHAGPEEKALQTRIAGLADWKPEYSFGRAFWTARDLIDPAVRAAALDAYLAMPEDGATPVAIAEGLARLKKGELLSPASTGRLLQIMADATTGPMRLKAGLGEGWTIAPDGRTYAVAVMIGSTRRPVPARQDLMAAVAAAVAAVHDGRDPAVWTPRPAP